eukprot:m.21585 g.21585  ORF g.21585 m.21585 type:complete len:51 (+) comp7183_c0_seq2:936-1088(+)
MAKNVRGSHHQVYLESVKLGYIECVKCCLTKALFVDGEVKFIPTNMTTLL